MEDLTKLLVADDSAAIELTRKTGEAALATLEAHLEHQDPDVRFLVVECLVALRTPAALRLLPPRIEDSSLDVRLEAVNALLDHGPVAGMGPELAALFDRTSDGFIRRQLALVLGGLEARESGSRLSGRLVTNDLAQDGLLAALARQGDPTARVRFAQLLREAEGLRVVEVLALFRYMGRADYTPDLLPLIEREEVVQNLSNDLTKIERRACDVALDEFLRLRPDEFAWGLRPPHDPYLYTELVEVRALLRREAGQA